MRLSTKMRYGARAMLELALDNEKGVVSTREIASHQQVSSKYLEHLLASLRSVGLVRSVRGAQGGHALAKPPDEINLRDTHCFGGNGGFCRARNQPRSLRQDKELCDMGDLDSDLCRVRYTPFGPFARLVTMIEQLEQSFQNHDFWERDRNEA